MRKDPIWIVTTPTPTNDSPASAELARAYEAHDAAGEILHVLSDPQTTTVLTSTRAAAGAALAVGEEAFGGPVVSSVLPGYLWTTGRDEHGNDLREDEDELAAMASTMTDLITVDTHSVYASLHPKADVSGWR